MKKITTALIIASLAVSPAYARGEHSERGEHHGGGGWVGPLIGGVILGAILTDSSERRRTREPEVVIERDRYYYRDGGYPDGYGCRFIPSEDRYGNRIYYRVCQ